MTEGRLLEGRVVIVTGAGRGLGLSHSVELAHLGARLVLNDWGVSPEGFDPDPAPSLQAAELVASIGGEAVSDSGDAGGWEGAERLVDLAISTYGRLDAVVNNAGIVRESSLVNLTEDDFDALLRTHLRAHVALATRAAARWRDEASETGPSDWRIVNTTSPVGLGGSSGQAAYVAAKAAIAAVTLAEAAELSRYGATANAIAPAARTRLTERVQPEEVAPPDETGAFDVMDPGNVSPLVCWLCSTASRGVTGRVFEVTGGRLSLMTPWARGASYEQSHRLEAEEIGQLVDGLLEATPELEDLRPGPLEAPRAE